MCSCNHCCSGKVISCTKSECLLVALGIQHWMRMCHIVVCGLSGSTMNSNFPRSLTNGTIFGKSLLNIRCVFRISVQLLSETFFIKEGTEQDIITNVYWPSCQVPVPVFRVKSYLNFLDRFSKFTQISDIMKIRPVGAELFHVHGRKDRVAW